MISEVVEKTRKEAKYLLWLGFLCIGTGFDIPLCISRINYRSPDELWWIRIYMTVTRSPYLFLNQEVLKNWLINMRVPKISAETNPVKRCSMLLAIFSEMPASWKYRSNNSRLKLEKFFEKSAKYHQIRYESSSSLKHLCSSREVLRAYCGSSYA